jgi:glyceraldehyde-3-phosphate dehydrogenase (NADP+)
MVMTIVENEVQIPGQIVVLDPQDGSTVGTVPAASKADAERAVDFASRAFESYRTLPANVRSSALAEVAKLLHEEREEFSRLIAREGIKTIREARREVARCVNTLKLSAEEVSRLTGETIPFDQAEGSENRVGYYRRIPLGVVVAITPFNDPLNLVAHKIGPAIAAGNAVILKPHSETPLSAQRLVNLFARTGLPAGLLQMLTGRGSEIGDTLVSDPRVRMISFTGGKDVGKHIQAIAGVKKLAMELGSSCPVIVFPDADEALALDASISGAFWAAGQNCLHVQRLLLHETIFDDFARQFCQRATALRVGNKLDDATDMGPMINEQAAKKLEALVVDALDSGASLLCGGRRQGNVFFPTVLANVDPTCAIAEEEVFGPVTILERFNSVEEAIAKANSVDYGLQAGIFTRDLNIAFRVADALDCGGVMINDSSDFRIDAMPFGGTRGSGIGREGVAHAAREMSDVKTYCFNLQQSVGCETDL